MRAGVTERIDVRKKIRRPGRISQLVKIDKNQGETTFVPLWNDQEDEVLCRHALHAIVRCLTN